MKQFIEKNEIKMAITLDVLFGIIAAISILVEHF